MERFTGAAAPSATTIILDWFVGVRWCQTRRDFESLWSETKFAHIQVVVHLDTIFFRVGLTTLVLLMYYY